MRWFVEISSLGQNAPPTRKVCVEAAQWQPALQKARALRGDHGPLNNFSVDLLESGYRAIDPATRVRYVVQRAPDDAALTDEPGAPAGAGASPRAAEPAARLPGKRPAAPTVPFISMGAALVVTEPASAAAQPASAAAQPASAVAQVADGAAQVAGTAAQVADGAAQVAGTAAEVAGGAAQPAGSAAQPAGSAAQPQSAAVQPASGDGAASAPAAPEPASSALPPFELVSQRGEDPSERSPLTYRELVYAVPTGTPRELVNALLLERLEAARALIDDARPGKFIHIAVFDHVFDGRPQRGPLATLAWKDWRSDVPELQFRPRAGVTTPPPALAPAAVAPPAILAPAAGAPAAAEPPAVTPPLVAEPPAAAAPAAAEPPAVTPPAAAEPPPVTPAAAEPPAVTPAAAAEPPAVMPPAAAEPPSAASPAAVETPAVAPPSAEPPSAASPAAAEPPAAVSPAAPPPGGPARPEAAPPPAEIPPPAPSQPVRRRSSFPPGNGRLSGDDLIAELFEACSDLHFLQDTLAGADFILALTLDKIPCALGFVSLFDINRGEFVVVRQRGGKSALLARLSERAPLPLAAMRSRRAVVVPDVSRDERALDDRWKATGVELRSVVCAPVELGGRYLGLLEIGNPLDGKPFSESDGNALTYIGQQFAEFVGARGVVIEPSLVTAGTKRAAR
ncbi:GAF domain-containing protein [Sorangium sp. So ce1151]|uniref:GAF domain-containing protein n=1 Tax=Sorangium sp. So ce1151 TaxID=3133332 RepID=UPI003F641E98